MDNFIQRLNILKGIKQEKERQLENNKGVLESENKKIESHNEAIGLVLIANRYIQERLEFCVSNIVTKALAAIYDNPYEFKLMFSTRGGKTPEATPMLIRDGKEFDPLSATGGGVVDVISFSFRLACLLLSGKEDKVLILDEPFKAVSRNLQGRVRAVVDKLSEDLGVQFMIITHEEEFE